MFALIVGCECTKRGRREEQVLVPHKNTRGIFGRSVDISEPSSNRVMVGASYESFEGGEKKNEAVYMSDYSVSQQEFVRGNQILTLNDTTTVKFLQLGSRLFDSRVLHTAPFMNQTGRRRRLGIGGRNLVLSKFSSTKEAHHHPIPH